MVQQVYSSQCGSLNINISPLCVMLDQFKIGNERIHCSRCNSAELFIKLFRQIRFNLSFPEEQLQALCRLCNQKFYGNPNLRASVYLGNCFFVTGLWSQRNLTKTKLAASSNLFQLPYVPRVIPEVEYWSIIGNGRYY